MKTKSILLLLIAVMFTSCAGKFGVMKRRYNKGYYVSVNHDRNKKPAGGQTTRQHETPLVKPAEQEEQVAVQYVPAEITPYKVQEANKVSTQSDDNKAAVRVSANAKPAEVVSAEKEIKVLQSIGERKQTRSGAGSASGDSDATIILLVILAIFIPPLAVYLKNKTIDTWFWVTLVLSLVGFLGFYTPFAWLAWLAAVIIAILYVLGNIGG